LILYIFDIDGTIVDSVSCDDACYVDSFKEVFGQTLEDVDWTQFNNITDSGLTYDLCQQYFNRPPVSTEIVALKDKYYDRLNKRLNEISPIPGAKAFIDTLLNDEKVVVSFATGGWEKTALLKSGVSGIDIKDYVYKTSDDHYNRVELLRQTIESSREIHNLSHFDQIISVGDGLWDLSTAQLLDIDFVGVDYHNNGRLIKAGAKRVVRDFLNMTAP